MCGASGVDPRDDIAQDLGDVRKANPRVIQTALIFCWRLENSQRTSTPATIRDLWRLKRRMCGIRRSSLKP
jgi:hypothetical protein